MTNLVKLTSNNQPSIQNNNNYIFYFIIKLYYTYLMINFKDTYSLLIRMINLVRKMHIQKIYVSKTN